MFLLILSTSTISGCFLHFNTSHVSINLKPYPWHHSTVFISIHLMFLLIQRWELYRHSKGGYFNTSHVSINHTGSIATTCVVRDFNTSHVSINLIHILPFWNAYRISIHLMFLLIAAAAPSDNTTTVISIHLMFLLIQRSNVLCAIQKFISIHLMFLLIRISARNMAAAADISIHLMFLLIIDLTGAVMIGDVHFNTSHVSINQNELEKNQITMEFQYISCFY